MVQGCRLIAMLALADSGERPCVNRERYAGTTVLQRQVDMAIAMSCDAIMLLGRNPADEDVLAAQHLAESEGLAFRLVSRPGDIAASVPKDADLIVIAPGVLARNSAVLEKLGAQKAIATLPADHAFAAGLERLDLHGAWAGMLRMPGRHVSQLDVLGPDFEPLSALPRIARSSGVEERAVSVPLLEDGDWRLPADDRPVLLQASEAPSAVTTLTQRCAGYLAARNLPDAYAYGVLVLALVGSVGLIGLGRPAIAIILAVAAMVAADIGRQVRKLAQPLRLSRSETADWSRFPEPACEVVAGIAAGTGLAGGESITAAAYSSVIALLLVWIARPIAPKRFRAFVQPPVIWTLAAIPGVFGIWWGAVFVPTMLGFGALAFHFRGTGRITQS